MKTPNTKKLLQARNLYFNTTLTQAQIADLIGMSQKTVSLYISRNNWKMLKTRHAQLPSVFIEQMNTELQRMNELIAARPEGQQFPTLQEAEIRRKIMYSLATIKERQSAGTHIETFMNLLSFAARDNRADALVISNYIQDFLKIEYNLPEGPPKKRHDLAGNPLPHPLYPKREDDEEELLDDEENEEENDNNDDIEDHNKSPEITDTNVTLNPPSPTEAKGVGGPSPLLPTEAVILSSSKEAKEGIAASEGASTQHTKSHPDSYRDQNTKNNDNTPSLLNDEPTGLTFAFRTS